MNMACFVAEAVTVDKYWLSAFLLSCGIAWKKKIMPYKILMAYGILKISVKEIQRKKKKSQ